MLQFIVGASAVSDADVFSDERPSPTRRALPSSRALASARVPAHRAAMLARRLASAFRRRPVPPRLLRDSSGVPGPAPSQSSRLVVGDVFSSSRAFADADVAAFASASADANPIHVDAAAARAAGLPGPVVHGMLLASMFGGIIGTRVPGAVYASQTIKFRAPVRVGESVRAEVRVASLGGSAATFETKIFGEGGEVAVDGTAVAMLPRKSARDPRE